MSADATESSERARFWSEVLRRNGRALFGAALAMCRQPADAEDLVQETLVHLARSPRRVSDPAAYALRSMRNRRATGVRREALHRGAIASLRSTIDRAEAPSERTSELLAAVDRLPVEQQEILTLRTRCGLSFPQIALVLDEPVGTVSSRYSRAIAALKESLLEGASRG